MENNIQKLEFTGIDGNQCIQYSIMDAIKLGCKINIDLNCIGVHNKEHFKRTLEILKQNNVTIKEFKI